LRCLSSNREREDVLSYNEPISRSELARALDVSRISLIRWEKAGLIPAPERIAPNRALYSPTDQMKIAAQVEASR
jgi:DNA-binding transcriptional MerR regulator